MRSWAVGAVALIFSLLFPTPLMWAAESELKGIQCSFIDRFVRGLSGTEILSASERRMVDEIHALYDQMYGKDGEDASKTDLIPEPGVLSGALSYARKDRQATWLSERWDEISPDLRLYYAQLVYDEAWRDYIFLTAFHNHQLTDQDTRFKRQADYHDKRVALGKAILDALTLRRRITAAKAQTPPPEDIQALEAQFKAAAQEVARAHYGFFNSSLNTLNTALTVQRLTLIDKRVLARDWLKVAYQGRGWKDWHTYVNPVRHWAFVTYIVVFKTQYYRWANASFFGKFMTPILVAAVTPFVISSMQMLFGGKFDKSFIGVLLEMIKNVLTPH